MTPRIRSVAHGFMLAGREAPGALARLIALNTVAGLAPAAMLYVQKIVIDSIADFGGAGGGLGSLLGSPWKLIAAGAVFVALDLVLDGVEQIVQFEAGTFCDKITAGARRLVQGALEKYGESRCSRPPDFGVG